MRLTRRSRFASALIALFGVLFMQLAMAAYACPSLQPVEPVAMTMASAEHDGMDGCEEVVDIEQPALCHAHAQIGDQSLDKPASPGVAPSVVFVLMPAMQSVGATDPPMPRHAAATWLMQDSFPPLSIRNCCFRI